jgi:hypothetical protein
MDEQTATKLAAQQIVDQLGKPAGFMIALRIMQVLAERTQPVTPELIDAFAACLKGMEKFATIAGLDQIADAPAQGDAAPGETEEPAGAEAPKASADKAPDHAVGINDPLKDLAEALGVGNGRGGWGGNGTPLA